MGVGIGLQVNVAHAQAGGIPDIQDRQHPGAVGAPDGTGGGEGIPVVVLAVLETEIRRHEPVPLILAGGFLDSVALGIVLEENAHQAAADRDKAAFSELVLRSQSIILIDPVDAVLGGEIVVPAGRVEGVAHVGSGRPVEIHRRGEGRGDERQDP